MMNGKVLILGIMSISIFAFFISCSESATTGDVETGSISIIETPEAINEVPEIEVSTTPKNSELPPNSYLTEIPRINVHQVREKLDGGVKILIVDSRGSKYYDSAHIIGAISLPLDDMAQPYTELIGYDEITTYCT